MRLHIAVLFIGMLAHVGCSTAPGRKLAEDLSSSTAAYEQQIARKIAAENKFYDEQLGIIRKHMSGEIELSKFETLTAADKESLVHQTLLYGRVLLGSQRQARLAAARILEGGGSPTTEIVEVVDVGISEDLQYARDLLARQQSLRRDRITGMAKLEYAKDDLATVRRQLAAIGTDVDAARALQAWLNFGQALRAELKKEQD